jgi:RNA polymerase sigma-70 factor, ECF subfamily
MENWMPQGDSELVSKACHGDLLAFDELFKKHENSIYRYALYLTGSQNKASELYQETWLRVAKAFQMHPSINNFKSWLVTITTNIFRDQLRKNKIRSFFLGNEAVEFDYYKNDDFSNIVVPSVRSAENSIDQKQAILEALDTLTLKQRMVFTLFYVEGFKIDEIGSSLKIASGTVKATLFKAVRKMRLELEEFK